MPYKPGEPITAAAGKSVKFVVTGDSGLRSSTWVVKSHKKLRDVFVGTVDAMGQVKLSFHSAGYWQLGYTTEHAKAQQIRDRIMAKFPPSSQEVRPGWTHVATVLIPASSLRPRLEDEPEHPGPGVSVWEGRKDHALRFLVMIGSPQAEQTAGHPGIGAAGYLQFRDGSTGVVIVDEVPIPPVMEGELLRLRIQRRRDTAASDPHFFEPDVIYSFTEIGIEEDTDAVLQIDCGDAPPWWPMAEGSQRSPGAK